MTKVDQLQRLYKGLEGEAASLPLAEKPQDIVPGEGNADAEVLLIGEAPGAQEQQQRRPFVGRSGQLLRKTLDEVGLPPSELYIANIVKARPPDNRDPQPSEITAYKPYLDSEITIIQPKLVVTLGRLSMAKFLPKVSISQVHGRLYRVVWQEKILYVLPMYHPAAALRGTTIKNTFIADIAKILQALNWIKQQPSATAIEEQVEEVVF